MSFKLKEIKYDYSPEEECIKDLQDLDPHENDLNTNEKLLQFERKFRDIVVYEDGTAIEVYNDDLE